MTIAELNDNFNTLFGQELLARFPDEWGITVHGQEPIRHIGYATNLTPETATAAREAGVQLLITHHDAWPFLFGMSSVCRQILQEAGISHCFVHLPLDDAGFGTNAALASRLGGEMISRTHRYQEAFLVGCTLAFRPPISFSTLVERIQQVLGEPVKAWQHHERAISLLSIVTGGGMMTSDIQEAVMQQCDAYLTGEKVLYTVEYARFAGMNLIVGSHTATEIFGVEGLVNEIIRLHPSLSATRIIEAHGE